MRLPARGGRVGVEGAASRNLCAGEAVPQLGALPSKIPS